MPHRLASACPPCTPTTEYDVASPGIWRARAGPCGGKSTAIREIAKDLRAAGLPAIVVPEAATFLVDNGVDRVGMIGTPTGLLAFNHQYALLQLEHEARLGAIAAAAAAHSATVECVYFCTQMCQAAAPNLCYRRRSFGAARRLANFTARCSSATVA